MGGLRTRPYEWRICRGGFVTRPKLERNKIMNNTFHKLEVTPLDEYNKHLLDNVRPENYVNPEPAARYNLVVIGAGTAGLVTAAAAAGLGAKVALVERNLMGGDCLNVGCVPSKAVIRAAHAASDIKKAARFGITAKDVEIDFAKAMEWMREVRSSISHHDSVARFSNLGIDIFQGNASFKDSSTVVVGDKTLRFKKAVIASGARAVELPIPGLAEAGYLTNENVFNLTERPKRLAVIGAGPIGCELAQSFARLGCEVFLLHSQDHILEREDADAAEIVQKKFIEEGITLVLKAKTERVEKTSAGKKISYKDATGKDQTILVDEILVGAGRAPNVEGLNLEAVGVEYDKRLGVKVNDHLQTTNPRIFAAGDICMAWKFTHAADAAARIVIQNVLFSILPVKGKLSTLTMPWCTYTDPEIAHVGLYEHEAKERGIELDTYRINMSQVDRAITEGETDGFLKIHTKKGSDQILGATVVSRHAGEMISEVSLALVHKIGLGKIASVIHPYPTQAEAVKKAADSYNRTKLTAGKKKLLTKIFSMLR